MLIFGLCFILYFLKLSAGIDTLPLQMESVDRQFTKTIDVHPVRKPLRKLPSRELEFRLEMKTGLLRYYNRLEQSGHACFDC